MKRIMFFVFTLLAQFACARIQLFLSQSTNMFTKWLLHQESDVLKREKIGSYGQPFSTSAIEAYGSFKENYVTWQFNLKVRENITRYQEKYL